MIPPAWGPLEPGVLLGIVGSLGAGLATGVGALPILGLGSVSERGQRLMLSFAAGIMLAASFFSLVLPALDEAARQGYGRFAAPAIVVSALLIGAAALEGLNRRLPIPDHWDARTRSTDQDEGWIDARPVWLLIIAITLHNIPEGAAVGMSFIEGDHSAGLSTAIGIGVQNVPEGLAVAFLLVAIGRSRLQAFGGALASGLVEPVAGAISALLVSWIRVLMPWGLAAAAGAMLLLVIGQLLPEVMGKEKARSGVLGAFFLGLGVMLFLDTAMG